MQGSNNKDLEASVYSNLRACLLSAQGGVALYALNNDYRQLLGESIPFRKLGFSSLESFIRSVPDVTIREKGGECFIEARASETSEHIKQLVERQKRTASRTRKRAPVPPSRRPPAARFHNRPQRFSNSRNEGGLTKFTSLGVKATPMRQNHPPPLLSLQVTGRPPAAFQRKPIHEDPLEADSQLIVPLKYDHPTFDDEPPKSTKNQDSKVAESRKGPETPKAKQKVSPPPSKPQPARALPVSTAITNSADEPAKKHPDVFVTNSAQRRLKSAATPKTPSPEPVPLQISTLSRPSGDEPPSSKSMQESKVKRISRDEPKVRQEPPTAVEKSTPPPEKIVANEKSDKSYELKAHRPTLQSQSYKQSQTVRQREEILPYKVFRQTSGISKEPKTTTKMYQGFGFQPPRARNTEGSAVSRRNDLFEGKLNAYCEPGVPYEPGSYVEKLVNLCEKNNWPAPNFIFLYRKDRGCYPLYSCRISLQCSQSNLTSPLCIESHDYSTLPLEYQMPDQAKETVARKAYEDLSKKELLSTKQMTVTSDATKVVSRVSEVVGGRKQGVWAFQIENDYRSRYNENLPANWISIINSSDVLTADKLADTSYIILPKDDTMVSYQRNGFCMKPKANDFSLRPQPLVIPDSTSWDVFITRACSTTEVWLRFIGEEYSALYHDLSIEMEAHYAEGKRAKLKAPFVKVNMIYVYATTDCCSRVQVLETPANNMVKVKFIDHGDTDTIPASELCVLDLKFSGLPSQAIKCTLHGMERYANEVFSLRLMAEYLEGQVMVAVPQTRGPVPALVLYDTSKDYEVNINSYMIEALEIQTSPSTLCEIGSIGDALMCGVNEKGVVHLLSRGKAFSYLEDTMITLTKEMYSPYRVTELSVSKTYLLAIPDGSKYRVQPLYNSDLNDTEVEVRFIDKGIKRKVSICHLYDLDEMVGFLSYLPNQAIPVILKDIDYLEGDLLVKFMEMVKDDESVMYKLESYQNGMPVVELFKRLQPGNILVSINHTVKINAQMQLFEKSMRRLDISPEPQLGFGDVTRPNIPAVNEKYFDVYIFEAANPSNFTVQPLRFLAEFRSMSLKMQVFYDSTEGEDYKLTSPVKRNDLVVVRDKSGGWCRAIVDQKIGSFQVSVKFCDYGNVEIIDTKHLRQLRKDFLKVPYIAFTSKLYGVVPTHGDWTTEDCVRFQNLIEGKRLVSVIKEKIVDPSLPNQLKLSLHIVDTNSDVDQDIALVLVSEGRARLA